MQAPTLCDECAGLLRPDTATLYCAHHHCLAVAERDEHGLTQRFVCFGPMSAAEAETALQVGCEVAARRFRETPRH